jgi:hypothetical protein
LNKKNDIEKEDGIKMRCFTVYTNDFEKFSELLPQCLTLELEDGQETTIAEIVINHSGIVDETYVDQYVGKMSARGDVVVMHDRDRELTILQYGDKFELFLPDGHLVAVK